MASKKREWTNLVISRETHRDIERLARMLGADDALKEKPRKHRAVALAVREAIEKRRG